MCFFALRQQCLPINAHNIFRVPVKAFDFGEKSGLGEVAVNVADRVVGVQRRQWSESLWVETRCLLASWVSQGFLSYEFEKNSIPGRGIASRFL